MLANMSTAFRFLNEEVFKKTYNKYVILKLEHGVSKEILYKETYRKLERMQHCGVRMVLELASLSYDERLKILQ